MRIRAARQTGANLGFEDKLWIHREGMLPSA